MASTPSADSLAPDDKTSRIAQIGRVASVDVARAIDLAKQARSEGVTDPLVHHLLGIDLKEAGRFEEAIAELGRGLELDPQNAGLMTMVGFCLLELGRRQEAAQVFGVAVKLDPTSADARYGYGWAAERLGALDSAHAAFQGAIALNPDHADALAGLSGLAVRRRDWHEARGYAQRAVDFDGRQTDALMNLARVEFGLGNFAAAERCWRDIIDLPHLKPLARADARIMLGDALDGAGRYQEAFDAYAAGKAELQEQHADAFGRPGAGSAIEGVGKILSQFRDTPASLWAKPPAAQTRHGERGHAFLLGFPRSGTTLLEQVLATHPDVAALGERPLLLDAEIEFLTQAGGVTRLAAVMSSLLEPFREAYWRRVREFGVEPRDKVVIDKNPLNTFRLPLIGKVFPDARIIFAIRDPRDVVLSCFRRNFNMNASMYQFNTIEGAARYYDAVMAAGEVYFATLPITTLRVRYEDLVSDFDASARALCDFLGIEWTERLRDFVQTANAGRIATPSSTQVGRGLYDEGVDQWRRYAFALEPVTPILQPWIDKFGYAPA